MYILKKFILLAIPALLLFGSNAAKAESPEKRESLPHEIRFGVGDQLFEHFVWQNPLFIVKNMSESYTRDYKERYRYSQHFFAEYQWRFRRRLSVGFQVDGSACWWDLVTRNGLGNEISRQKNQNFWNLTLMPTLQFNWMNRDRFSLYSSLGIGLGLNGGSETDAYGNHTLCGLAFQYTLLGASLDWSRWFAFAALGGLSSAKEYTTDIFMLNSRIISLGAGFRF